MKRHLNTLFVTTQGSYLAKDGETVVVRADGEVRARVPIHNLAGVVCFGNVGCSPFLMGFCGERGVALSFLTENGRFLARVEGPQSGNVLLRREQYRRADDPEATAAVASCLVLGKIANCRAVLQRCLRDHSVVGEAAVSETIRLLSLAAAQTQSADADLERLRGIEGNAGRLYFECFDSLIVQQRDEFSFRGRSRRPPLDPVNSLLSFIYTLLVHDIVAALESVGLDPQVGFLHRDRPGRPSLALDLMEELRPWLADRVVLSLINLRQVRSSDFVVRETNAVALEDDARKRVLAAYQKRKDETISHPFLGEKTTVGLLPHLQARLLARYLRGDLDGYPPFVPK